MFKFFSKKKTLHEAVQSNDVDLVRTLLAEGADVNAVDKKGATPIFYTANLGSVETAEILLEHGADILYSVASGGGTVLHSAILKRHEALSLFLIERGADVNKATIAGVCPLHVAAQNGMGRVVQALLLKGAEVNALTQRKQNPLWFAVIFSINALNEAEKKGETLDFTDWEDIICVLVEAGGDPSTKGQDTEGKEIDMIQIACTAPETATVLAEEIEVLLEETEDTDKRAVLEEALDRLKRSIRAHASLDDDEDGDGGDDDDRPDQYSEQPTTIHSSLLGELVDEGGYSYFASRPVPIPLYQGEEAPILYRCEELYADPDFVKDADAAVSNFLKLGESDRLHIAEMIRDYVLINLDAWWSYGMGFDSVAEASWRGASWRGYGEVVVDDDWIKAYIDGEKESAEVWHMVGSVNEIIVQRNYDSDTKLYVSISANCMWEDHGFNLVFREGKECTRFSIPDGHLED